MWIRDAFAALGLFVFAVSSFALTAALPGLLSAY
jgi:hypothetical protein